MTDLANKFDEPIQLNLWEFGPINFRSLDEIEQWALREQGHWQDIKTKIEEHNPFSSDFFLGQLTGRPRHIIEKCKELRKPKNEQEADNLRGQLRGQLEKLQEFPGLTHMTVTGKRIQILADASPVAAWLALALEFDGTRQGRRRIDIPHIKSPVALIASAGELRESDIDGKNSLAAFDERSTDVLKRWERQFNSKFSGDSERFNEAERVFKELGSAAAIQLRSFEDLHKKHEDRMADMERAFSTEMKLRAAEKFWEIKRKVNRKRASTAFRNLSFVGGAGLALLLGMMVALVERYGLPGGFSLTHTIMLGVPIVLYVWLIRIFATEFKVNQRMADDAEERQAMVMTFKALEYEDKAAPDERVIILNALFRPHDAASDEAVPVAAIEALVNRQK